MAQGNCSLQGSLLRWSQKKLELFLLSHYPWVKNPAFYFVRDTFCFDCNNIFFRYVKYLSPKVPVLSTIIPQPLLLFRSCLADFHHRNFFLHETFFSFWNLDYILKIDDCRWLELKIRLVRQIDFDTQIIVWRAEVYIFLCVVSLTKNILVKIFLVRVIYKNNECYC